MKQTKETVKDGYMSEKMVKGSQMRWHLGRGSMEGEDLTLKIFDKRAYVLGTMAKVPRGNLVGSW